MYDGRLYCYVATVKDSTNIPIRADDTLVAAASHETESTRPMNITVIEMLADLLDLDPMTDCLCLEEHINVDFLNAVPENEADDFAIGFSYGGYFVLCMACGELEVYADSEEYRRGEVELPHSMC